MNNNLKSQATDLRGLRELLDLPAPVLSVHLAHVPPVDHDLPARRHAALALAIARGADDTVKESLREALGVLAPGDPPRSFEQAFSSLRRGGRLVCVALPADDKMTVPIFDAVLGGKSIIGSIVGTRADLADVFALHAAGRTRVIAEARRLDDVNLCVEEVLAGKVPARLVFTF